MKSIKELTSEAARTFMDKNRVVYIDEYAFMNGAEWERKRNKWISVKDQPLFTYDRCGNMICTEEGSREFIAAVPYVDRKHPDKELWWIRHCTIEDGTGLCVVGDIENESSGWQLEQITHWQPLPQPPKQNS